MVVATSGIPNSFNWVGLNDTTVNLTAKPQLSTADKENVQQLKALDKQVRAHEQEHLRAGGALVRGGDAKFEYTAGPDGKLYAVRGGVEVDADPIKNDPQAALEKAAKLRKTAMANGLDASQQDQRVAAVADKQTAQAQFETDQWKTIETRRTQARMVYAMRPGEGQRTLSRMV